jgi:hypothetical protein
MKRAQLILLWIVGLWTALFVTEVRVPIPYGTIRPLFEYILPVWIIGALIWVTIREKKRN